MSKIGVKVAPPLSSIRVAPPLSRVKHASRCCQASESLLSSIQVAPPLSSIRRATPLSLQPRVRVAAQLSGIGVIAVNYQHHYSAVKHPSCCCQASESESLNANFRSMPTFKKIEVLGVLESIAGPAGPPSIAGVRAPDSLARRSSCIPMWPRSTAEAVPAGAIYPASRGFQCHCRAGGTYSDPGRRRGVDGVVESRIPITRPDLAVSGRRSARACRVSERLVTSSGWYDSDRLLRRMITTGPP